MSDKIVEDRKEGSDDKAKETSTLESNDDDTIKSAKTEPNKEITNSLINK